MCFFLYVLIYVPLLLYKYVLSTVSLFHCFCFFFSTLLTHKWRKMFLKSRLLWVDCIYTLHTAKQMRFEISSIKIAFHTFQSLTTNNIKFINEQSEIFLFLYTMYAMPAEIHTSSWTCTFRTKNDFFSFFLVVDSNYLTQNWNLLHL